MVYIATRRKREFGYYLLSFILYLKLLRMFAHSLVRRNIRHLSKAETYIFWNGDWFFAIETKKSRPLLRQKFNIIIYLNITEYITNVGEGRLGFPDLWSDKKNPDWTVNFGEVRRTQLAKYTILSSTLVPLGLFQIFKVCWDARERESRVQKATGSYRTYLYLVKLRPWFLNL